MTTSNVINLTTRPHAPVPDPAGRPPPHDLDAEAVVLSGCLCDVRGLDQVADVLAAEDFYSSSNASVFRAALAIRERGDHLGLVEVKDELERSGVLESVGGVQYLVLLQDAVPARVNLNSAALIVRRKGQLRRAIALCQLWAAEAYGGVDEGAHLAALTTRVQEMALAGADKARDGVTLRDSLQVAFGRIQKLAESGGCLGIPTGLKSLDYMLGGLLPGQLTILAARPGVGKSALATTVAAHVAGDKGLGVILVSLEMPHDQISQRLLCTVAEVDVCKMRRADYSPVDWQRLASAAEKMSPAPICIVDVSNLRPAELSAKTRRIRATMESAGTALGLIIVDYLQLMNGRDPSQRGGNREQEIASIARSLKVLAKDMGVPVLALSQLNRTADGERPKLSQLRESGAIEQDADNVLFIYRPHSSGEEKEDPTKAEIIIAKQRSGPIGTVLAKYEEAITRFSDWSGGDYGR